MDLLLTTLLLMIHVYVTGGGKYKRYEQLSYRGAFGLLFICFIDTESSNFQGQPLITVP